MLSFSLPLARGGVVASGDPLVRWSRRLAAGWPVRPLLPNVCVGLEGCAGAFNAMNSIRTCMFFGTALPPSFLSLSSAKEIKSFCVRSGGAAEALRTVASFGEDRFLEGQPYQRFSLVALENYTDRSVSILSLRLPPTARFVVGHENNGVSRKYIDGLHQNDEQRKPRCCAEHVVYVPQCGTISSLNVVTSIGIALFYAMLDKYCPLSRTVLGMNVMEDSYIGLRNEEVESLHRYQRCFRQQLPINNSSNNSLRIDKRPIHPLYYQKSPSCIVEQHHQLRRLMLQVCRRKYSLLSGCFGLSVLYENGRDQRSLGGIIRNSNAFLVDHVFYFGRKKVNVVGTVGTQHYTSPVYLGRLPDNNDNNCNNSGMEIWTDELQKRVEEFCGAAVNWWFLDCGHAFLYATKNVGGSAASDEDPMDFETRRHKESLLWYSTHCNNSEFALSLCDTEEKLRRVAKGGVVLIVPQEGILPPPHLLRRCSKVLSLLPKGNDAALSAGLPISVAAGIAIQRLSAVMHPDVLAF